MYVYVAFCNINLAIIYILYFNYYLNMEQICELKLEFFDCIAFADNVNLKIHYSILKHFKINTKVTTLQTNHIEGLTKILDFGFK